MDETDEKIIEAMKKESLCTPKISEIAKILDMPASTVHSRIKQMEKKGLIKSYVPIIDMDKTGPYVESFMFLKINPGEKVSSLIDYLKKFDFVKSIYLTTGEWYVLIKLRMRDMGEYDKISEQILLYKELMGAMDSIVIKAVRRDS